MQELAQHYLRERKYSQAANLYEKAIALQVILSLKAGTLMRVRYIAP